VVLLLGWVCLPAAAEPAGEPMAPHVFYADDGGQVVGALQRIRARQQDTLPDLGRLFDLGYEEITRANPGVDPWLPGEGAEIVLPTLFVLPEAPHDGLVLNMAGMRLYYFTAPDGDGRRNIYTHPIGIGRVGWSTPLGTTRITARAENPSWYVPESIRKEHAAEGDPLPAVVPPGPDNPLGRHVLRLAMPSYLIHGTNKPWGVGMRVSHGCIRLYPEDIEALYSMVPTDTPVHIVDQPYLAAGTGWRPSSCWIDAFAKRRKAPQQRTSTGDAWPALRAKAWGSPSPSRKTPRNIVRGWRRHRSSAWSRWPTTECRKTSRANDPQGQGSGGAP